MRTFRALAVATFAGLATTAAHAGVITFSFADPVPGRQMTAVAGGGGGSSALLTYDTSARISLLVDGSAEGFGALEFTDARMELSMALGVTTTMGGVTVAPVSGTFTIYDMSTGSRRDIITGASQNGAFVRVLGTNSLQFATPDGFTYLAGPALTALLAPGRELSPYQEASFSLTDIQTVGGGAFIAPDGSFRSFTANSSYSGNTEVIPAPGALALAGLGGLMVARRRRN